MWKYKEYLVASYILNCFEIYHIVQDYYINYYITIIIQN